MVARPRRSVFICRVPTPRLSRRREHWPPTLSSWISRIPWRRTPRRSPANRWSRPCAPGDSARVKWLSESTAPIPHGEPMILPPQSRRARRDSAAQGRRPRHDHAGRPRASRSHAPEKTRIWAMMETPMAILSAGSIAATAADPTLAARSAGHGPQRSRQGDPRPPHPRPPAFIAWIAICIAAARAHGSDILDGVYNDIDDLDRLPRRMRAGPRFRSRRQDADPSEPARHL